jgi:hypothetical protein
MRQCIAQTAPAPDPPDTTATASASAAHSDRPISWKLLVPDVIHDQKPIWLFPKAVAEGKHITPTIAVVSITGGLIALDPIDTPYFRRTQSFAAFNRDFSGLNTTVAMAAFPVAFYMYGLARKDSYTKHTVLLAGEAVIDSEILTTVMKDIDRRMLPGQVRYRPTAITAIAGSVGTASCSGVREAFPRGTPSPPSRSPPFLPTVTRNHDGIDG